MALRDPAGALSLAPFDYVLINKMPRNGYKTIEHAAALHAERQWSEVAQTVFSNERVAVLRVRR